jgi:1-acyl-sn-glycerol-3-phosphate acyltransferase
MVFMNFKKIITTTWLWTIGVISLIVLFLFFLLLWLVTLPFDRKHFISQKYTHYWGTFYLKILPIAKVEVIDKHKLIRDKAAIAISNHQSMVDIMVLFNAYAYFIWVSKIENFRMPILGWVMYMNGYISLKRDDPKTFIVMFEQITKALKDNRTIMMFPEGTRSITGELGRFKEGAFKAAIENKVSIIPIVLDGTGSSIPKEGISVNKSKRIVVKVLDEVPYEQFPSKNPSELKEYFKSIIANELINLRKHNM